MRHRKGGKAIRREERAKRRAGDMGNGMERLEGKIGVKGNGREKGGEGRVKVR